MVANGGRGLAAVVPLRVARGRGTGMAAAGSVTAVTALIIPLTAIGRVLLN